MVLFHVKPFSHCHQYNTLLIFSIHDKQTIQLCTCCFVFKCYGSVLWGQRLLQWGKNILANCIVHVYVSQVNHYIQLITDICSIMTLLPATTHHQEATGLDHEGP